ncbi:transposase [Terrimonas rubra]|uniref:Transposase n=1 Tax=Terrimonas rubra TaxID=1035890 RepID=A0ABW6A3I2_9BACT
MSKYHIPLMPGTIYHVFNRAVGSEKLFLNQENYRYFLVLLNRYILPVADLLAYALLPNHFHLLVRLNSREQILSHYHKLKMSDAPITNQVLLAFIMKQFSNWLNAYAKAFNKMYHRKGSLFIDYLKRCEAKTDSDITAFIFYIHKNAVHHGLTSHIGQWSFDSYQAIISDKPTCINRSFCINWFGGLEAFISFHQQPVQIKK